MLQPCMQHADLEPASITRIPDNPLPQGAAKFPSLSITRPFSLTYVLSHLGAVLGTKELTLMAPQQGDTGPSLPESHRCLVGSAHSSDLMCAGWTMPVKYSHR